VSRTGWSIAEVREALGDNVRGLVIYAPHELYRTGRFAVERPGTVFVRARTAPPAPQAPGLGTGPAPGPAFIPQSPTVESPTVDDLLAMIFSWNWR
jgi:hypothetical protein